MGKDSCDKKEDFDVMISNAKEHLREIEREWELHKDEIFQLIGKGECGGD